MTEANKIWKANNEEWNHEMKLCIAGNEMEMKNLDFQIGIMQQRKESLEKQTELLFAAMEAQQQLIDESFKDTE